MKRVVSVLLLVCMLVSLMGMSAAAYAEEPAGDTAVPGQEVTEQNEGEQGQEDAPVQPSAPAQPEPTQAPETAQPSAAPETAAQPETTEKPAADEGFFAALSDADTAALTAELAKLGYTVTDRAGLCALAAQLGIGDMENFRIWLDNELYLRENAAAEVNGQLYETLDAALKVLEGSRAAEIKLLKDTEVVGLSAPAEHELTLDLNGKTLYLAPYEDGAPSCITVVEAEKISEDDPTVVTYSHAALIIKNGVVSAQSADDYTIFNNGALTLINVDVFGGIYVNSNDGAASLGIQPDGLGLAGYVSGNIDAVPGGYSAIGITGGSFVTDVSAFVDTSAYECALDEQTGLYVVARIKDAGADTAPGEGGTPAELPRLARVEVREGEVKAADGVTLENAAVTLTGLNNALSDDALAQILAAYEAAAPAQTQQARRASRAVVFSEDENSGGADENSDASVVADGTELRLTVKAVLTAAVEGSSVSYEVKPYAVINGVEVPVKNEWLNGQDMLLSFYTGFLPKTVEHVHDDGTVENIDLNTCAYNNGMLTLNVSSFSTFNAGSADFAAKVSGADAGSEITLTEDVVLNAAVAIDKNLTINLNGHTLEMANPDGVMFKITNNAMLTVKGLNGALNAANAYVASLETGSALVLGDDYDKNNTSASPMTVTANTTNGLISTADKKAVTIKYAKLNVDPSAYTVASDYTAMENDTGTEWTVGIPVAMITRTTGSIAAGDLKTVTLYYDTLKDAINAASTTTKEIITLLADIDEGDINVDRSVSIRGTHQQTKYGITGSVTASAGSPTLEQLLYITGKVSYTTSASLVTMTLRDIDTIGTTDTAAQDVIEAVDNVVLNIERCGTVNGSIKAGSANVNVNSVAAGSVVTCVTGSITSGGGNLTVKNADVTGDINSFGSAQRTVTIENSSVNAISVSETADVTGGANATFKADTVQANNIVVGSVNSSQAVSAAITDCTVREYVTIGDGFNKVSVTGLVGSGAPTPRLTIGKCRDVGTSTGPITIKGTAKKNMWIDTVDIADGNRNVTIEGHSKEYPTIINTVNINGTSTATFGDNLASSDTNDVKLEIGTVNCGNGTVTINNGTFGKSIPLNDETVDTLAVTGTGKFLLNGGNYHRDYSVYCDCTPTNDGSTQGTHYNHKDCKLAVSTIGNDGYRYRVSTLAPVVIVPASKEAAGAITRGTQTNLTFVTDAPYTHDCTGNRDLFGVQVDNVYLTEGTQYTVAPYTYTHDGITEECTQVTLLASYVGSLTATTHRINLDTEVGKATSYADGNAVQIKVNLQQTNRRSGIIRTGDDSNIGMLIGIMVLTLAVTAAVVVILRKKKSQTAGNETSAPAKPDKPKEK